MGVTPHQYVLRARLRRAGLRLKAQRAKVLDIALDSGFGDVSNFNRAFRAEFGVSPRDYRRQEPDETATGGMILS
jgi:AraC-like DNA-binding protein